MKELNKKRAENPKPEIVEKVLTPEEWEEQRQKTLAMQKFFYEMDMRDFDEMPREVRDLINYQDRYEIDAGQLKTRMRYMKRKLTWMGLVKLVQKGHIRLNSAR